jgi:hypothetical protein
MRLSLAWLKWAANGTPLPHPAPHGTTRSPYNGPVPPLAWLALAELWAEPYTVSSDFARKYAEEVALLASLGWISTIGWDERTYSRLWRLTGRGHVALVSRSD